MNGAIAVESLKARRSRTPWVTVLVTLVGGLFMFILQDQGRARSLGLLGAKATLAASAADWPGYFGFLGQATAIGGMAVFGLVLAWMFGREFGQSTVKDLLALPTPRATIVGAKFTVAAVWCVLLDLYTYLLGLAVGTALGLPGWSTAVGLDGLTTLLATTAMTFLLATPVALAASIGRGYLTGVGFMVAAIFLAQVVAALGYGHYFPWSVPALFNGLAAPGQPPPGPLGYTLVGLVGASGIVATAAWWTRADHDR
ncbi:MAG: ABC transporter permease [Umezawaea sp.]